MYSKTGSEVLNNQRESAAINFLVNGAGGAQAAADGADDDSDVSLDVDEVSVASECTTVSLRA